MYEGLGAEQGCGTVPLKTGRPSPYQPLVEPETYHSPFWRPTLRTTCRVLSLVLTTNGVQIPLKTEWTEPVYPNNSPVSFSFLSSQPLGPLFKGPTVSVEDSGEEGPFHVPLWRPEVHRSRLGRSSTTDLRVSPRVPCQLDITASATSTPRSVYTSLSPVTTWRVGVGDPLGRITPHSRSVDLPTPARGPTGTGRPETPPHLYQIVESPKPRFDVSCFMLGLKSFFSLNDQ